MLNEKLMPRCIKSLVKSGIKASEALAKASEATGVKLSQYTVIKDYNKFFGENSEILSNM